MSKPVQWWSTPAEHKTEDLDPDSRDLKLGKGTDYRKPSTEKGGKK